MNFVLFHIGNDLPPHFKYCVRQIRYTNPNTRIYIITNLNIVPPDPYIQMIPIQTLIAPDIGDYYKNDTYADLWRTSILRLFYIENFLLEYNIKDVIHFDNDILIYENIDTIADQLKQFNLLITAHFKTQYVFGFSYIKDFQSLSNINNELLQLVRLGENKLKTFITDSMPHEMRLLAYINEKHDNKLISNLPILPSGEGNDNFEIFKVCFDPSTYGKHIGGSHEHGPHNRYFIPTKEWTGTESHHYIGKALINNDISVKFENNKPIIIDKENKTYKLFNLHIHTKELQKWMSPSI